MSDYGFEQLFVGFPARVTPEFRQQMRLVIRQALRLTSTMAKELEGLRFAQRDRIEQFRIEWRELNIWSAPYIHAPGVANGRERLYAPYRSVYDAYEAAVRAVGFFGRRKGVSMAEFNRTRLAMLTMMQDSVIWLHDVQPDEDRGR